MAGPLDELRASTVTAYQDLVATLDKMSPDEMLLSSPNEGWTAKDTLAHLCSIQARQRGGVKSVLEGTAFPTDPVDDYNDRMVTERRDWSITQLRAELDREQERTLALLDTLSDADLAREFDHPRRGRMQLAALWQVIPNHVRTHTRDIAATRKEHA